MDFESESKLLRLLYVFVFYLIYRVTDLILLCLMVIQSVLNIVTGEPSETLREFGSSMGQYVRQITRYLSYAGNEKPFPFSDWPEPDQSDLSRRRQIADE